MGERRGTKALELWCRRITDGYPGVSVQNMTTSWRDGLAFCAMIHHFRPDLIDFNSLNKDDIYGNNELAFRTAEQHLGIPALLDAEDMASCSVPDRLSILTYLSQFYQVFGGSSPSRLALNRSTESTSERISPVVPESPQPKVSSRLGMRREPCASCGLPVYLAEKLVVAHHIYHRSCFKCARCSHQLTPGNYYETEDGQYCCEACPMDDEEIEDNEDELKQQQPHFTSYREPPDDQQEQQQQQQQQQQLNITTSSSSSSPSKAVVDLDEQDAAAVLEAPLSDEEKSKRRSLDRNVDRLLSSQKSRLDIISSHLLGDKIGELDIQETSNSSKDRVDGIDVQQERVVLLATGESDEEKTAKSRLNSVKMVEEDKAIENTTEPKILLPSSALMPDDDSDDKFDEMIKLINDRIDELTTEEKTTTDEEKLKKEEAVEEEDKKIKELASPDSRRESNVNNAPNVVEIRRASDDIKRENDFTRRLEEVRKKEKEESDQEATPALRRSSSLRDTGEHTKDQKISAEPRRLSLVQRRLKFFETEPHDNEPEPSMPGPELQPVKTEQQPVQPISPVSAKSDHSVVDSLEKNKQRESEVQKDEDYPEDLNPFASDDEHNESPVKKKPASTNPFGSSDEDEIEEVPPKPMARTRSKGAATMAREHEVPKKRVLEAPQINLNPFWSDDEEPESENEVELRNKSPPVPKPRTLRQSHMDGSLQPKSNLTSSSIHSSNTSIASSCSTITPGGTYRKKKPAPPPPLLNQSYNTPIKSPNASTNSNASLSPRLTPRTRKSKPAPPPPLPTAASTPAQQTTVTTATKPISDSDVVTGYRHSTTTLPDESVVLRHHHDNETRIESQQYVWDDEKLSKDEANRNTQSLHLPYTTDKSVEGKWKRKKGPAPPRPMPLRRKIKVMSMKDVKLELDQIEMQQQGLEKQGVRLEQIIRDKCESGTASEESSLGFDVEELVLELFSLVNEKNELFRRQAELMLLRRQQRLEEEHADIEYQVRCLITQPEATKTDFDKQREEMLIQRLVEIVERRNEIVECLEMDRRREIEEDRSIHREMDLYAARNKSDNVNMTDESRRSSKLKKGKVKEKTKEKKSKKSNKKDADKDVDETEAKLKRHSLRKWF